MKILTINSGSSSLKFSIYRIEKNEMLEYKGEISRIGMDEGIFEIYDVSDNEVINKQVRVQNHNESLKMLFKWLEKNSSNENIAVVGHRLVHGGTRFIEPVILDDNAIHHLKELIPLAPEHLPHEIKAIKIIKEEFPEIEQVACFDTSFHHHMPRIAKSVPINLKMWNEGIRRYGFHGLSYEYIIQELEKEAGSKIFSERIIIAHLGNGASMAAIKNGKSVDTTMGFTPAGGLVMGTRSGDLDPGIIVYLQKEKNFTAESVNKLVNEKSGLLGLSGSSSNMKDLLERQEKDENAKLAIDIFCYQAKKYLGGLINVLGGLDTLVFTAGIGENSSEIRRRICENTEYLGLKIDERRNTNNDKIISSENSKIVVRVMKTNEELMIARHSKNIVNKKVSQMV